MGAAALPVAIGAGVGGGLLGYYGAQQSGSAQSAYYKYLAGNANINASLALATGEANAKAIGAQAGFENSKLIRKRDDVIGAQKAGMAANGVIGGRTRQDIIKDTLMKSEMDVEALNYNANLAAKNARLGAKMSAFNYMNEAGGDEMASRNAKRAGDLASYTSLLGGARQAGGDWYMANR